MGWSSELFCNVSFNKEAFNSKYEVANRIEENELSIRYAEERIKNLVMITEPKKFIDEEYDPISYLSNECKEELEIIKDYAIENYKLSLLLENWDNCHNEEGLAIDPPETVKWNTAYFTGDFVKSVKYPNINK